MSCRHTLAVHSVHRGRRGWFIATLHIIHIPSKYRMFCPLYIPICIILCIYISNPIISPSYSHDTPIKSILYVHYIPIIFPYDTIILYSHSIVFIIKFIISPWYPFVPWIVHTFLNVVDEFPFTSPSYTHDISHFIPNMTPWKSSHIRIILPINHDIPILFPFFHDIPMYIPMKLTYDSATGSQVELWCATWGRRRSLSVTSPRALLGCARVGARCGRWAGWVKLGLPKTRTTEFHSIIDISSSLVWTTIFGFWRFFMVDDRWNSSSTIMNKGVQPIIDRVGYQPDEPYVFVLFLAQFTGIQTLSSIYITGKYAL